MDLMFSTKKVLSALVLPPTSLLLLIMLGLLLLGRWPRAGRAMAWIGIGLLVLLSLPVTSSMLMDTASTEATFTGTAARDAQAIVILGGGRRYAPEYGGETVSEFTLERIRYGAKIARETELPILVTGGVVHSGTPEAELMTKALRDSFSTPVQWIEGRARDTHENAQFSADILRRAGIHTVILVTHDFHQRRGIAEFSAAGIKSIPAPVTLAAPEQERSFPEHLPNAAALHLSALALHELLGYWVLAPKR